MQNPDRYFQQSRLHHLSRWKQELAGYSYNRIANNKQRQQHDLLVIHVDMDAFFCSCHLLDATELDRQHPTAVSHGTRTSEVSSCNYAARQYGISSGMFVSQAMELCPHVCCAPNISQ